MSEKVKHKYYQLNSAVIQRHRINKIWHIEINGETFFKSRSKFLSMLYKTYVLYRVEQAMSVLEKYQLASKRND